ncbi:MAG: transposase [Deltaproteobacteria bacterium]|nr:transposase [Deltaproteobacteria bacterium]
MERFIGLDVHAASTTCAVIDARGKRVRVDVVETNGQALIEFLKLQPGTLRLCLEEGTQATWLAEILTPHVTQLAVVHVRESRGPKDDERDALALAEQMRTGKLETTVYKHVGPFGALRNLVKTHAMVVRDVVRTQNRIRALFRSRAGRTGCGQGGLRDEGARSLGGEAAVERTERRARGASRRAGAEARRPVDGPHRELHPRALRPRSAHPAAHLNERRRGGRGNAAKCRRRPPRAAFTSPSRARRYQDAGTRSGSRDHLRDSDHGAVTVQSQGRARRGAAGGGRPGRFRLRVVDDGPGMGDEEMADSMTASRVILRP